jgi:bacillithiol biosynthesis cysteine-adding enzyme BshC
MTIDLQIQLKQIRETAPLFNDYLYNFQKVENFYRWHPYQELNQCFTERQSAYTLRKEVLPIISQQNRSWNASRETMDNIKKLSRENTMAVVTGQQAGILGGPLYTVYKILHIVKLATVYEKDYPDFNFVPVFWMEVGDNDYKEINHINFLNFQNEIVRLGLPENNDDGRSIYLREIPDEINDLLAAAEKLFPENEFRDQLLAEMKEIYSPGKSFADAFASWLHVLFGDFGIIVIQPTAPEVAALSVPLLKKAVSDQASFQEKIQKNQMELNKAGYTPQVIVNPRQTLLFYRLNNEKRARLDFKDQHFIAADASSETAFSPQSLRDEINKNPERFTPNVLFRPVVQDWLLPTAVYVGGPGEISYAAQLHYIYEIFGVTTPGFIPRARLTLVEDKVRKVIEKMPIDILEIFQNPDELIENHVKNQSDPRIQNSMSEIKIKLNDMLAELGDILAETDPTLESTVQKTTKNIADLLSRLEGKAISASERKMQTEVNQIKKVQMNLLPDKFPQERVLNIYQYLFKYGTEIIRKIYAVLQPEARDHQIIYF